jgi:hypothetical protein
MLSHTGSASIMHMVIEQGIKQTNLDNAVLEIRVIEIGIPHFR